MKKKSIIIMSLFSFWIISCLLVAHIYQERINILSNELAISNSELEKSEEKLVEANYKIEDLITTLEKRTEELNRALEVQYSDLTIEEMFRLAANTYEIDYDMLYAIAKLETGNFTSDLFINNNNPGGLRGSDWLSFNSKQEGIMEMARLLKRNYINQGLDTIDEIATKYCPDAAADWATKVKQLMN